jgi:hypothetical protein
MIRRGFSILAGLAMAVASGIVTLPIVCIFDPALARETGALIGAGSWHLVMTLFESAEPEHVLRSSLSATWSAIVLFCCAPVLLTAMIGEAARVRALIWYAGATAILAVVLPRATAFGMLEMQSGSLTRGLLLTGCISGCVYWWISGRHALATDKISAQGEN